jgi:hypothetical protein
MEINIMRAELRCSSVYCYCREAFTNNNSKIKFTGHVKSFAPNVLHKYQTIPLFQLHGEKAAFYEQLLWQYRDFKKGH